MKKKDVEYFFNVVIKELGRRIEVWLKAKEEDDLEMCGKMKWEVQMNLWYLDLLKKTVFASENLYQIIIDEIKSDFWGVFQGKKRVEVLSEGNIFIEDYVKKDDDDGFFSESDEADAKVIEFEDVRDRNKEGSEEE